MNAINGQLVRSADGARFEVRPVSEVDPSPFNHRKFFNPVEMWEMTLSIVDHGVDTEAHARLHPADPNRLQLSSGHRRRLGAVIAVLIREGLTEAEYFAATRGHLTPADGDKPAIWTPPSKEDQAAWLARLEEAAPRALLPCKVREMTDEEVLEDQGAENLQRSAPNCLEVADYFDILMRPRPEGMGMTLDQVEAKTRKERGFIVRHLKLLKLAPEVREALEKDEFGEQGEAYALLLARIPTHALQVAALDRVLLREQRRFRNDEPALLSLTDTKKMISQHFMMALVEGQTPFDMANAGLVEGRPACGPCEDRTGNQRALFADVASGSVCTNLECYQAKTKAQMLLDAQRDGAKVLSDAAARKVIHYGRVEYDSGYVELDDTVYEPGGRQRKWRDILKGKMPPETRAFHEGQRYDLVKKEDAKKVLDQVAKEKAAKKKEAGPAKLTPAEQKSRDQAAEIRDKAKADAEIRQLVMRAAIKAWPANPSEDLLRALAEAAIHGAWADTQVEAVAVLELGDIKAKNGSRGAGAGELLGKYVKGLKSKSSLLGFVALLMFGRSLSSTWDSKVTGRLKELCEHTGTDFSAIEKDVRGKYSKAKKEKAARKRKREEAETRKAERAKAAKGKAGKGSKGAPQKSKGAQPAKASAPKKTVTPARARAPKASKDLPFDEREEARQDEAEANQEQACEICHCTESNACKHPNGHPCSWADLDLTLCSVCMELLEAVEEQLLEGPKAEQAILDAVSELTAVVNYDAPMGKRVLARMEREGTIVKKDGRWALVQGGEPVPPQPEKKSSKAKTGKTARGAGRSRASRAPAVDLEALDTDDDGAPSEQFESYEPGETVIEESEAPAPKRRGGSWRRVWAGRGPAHTARALGGAEPSHTVCGLPITAKMKEPPLGVKDCASCERMRESETAHGATVTAPSAEPTVPAAPADMTEASVLASLAEVGPGKIGDLAARFGKKPMELSALLFQLQAATLVTFDKANGRVWTLTATGRAQLAAEAEKKSKGKPSSKSRAPAAKKSPAKGAAAPRGTKTKASPAPAPAPKKSSKAPRAPDDVDGDLEALDAETAHLASGSEEGKCRVCGCTEMKACVTPATGPCCWVDVEETLCSLCAELEQAIEEVLAGWEGGLRAKAIPLGDYEFPEVVFKGGRIEAAAKDLARQGAIGFVDDEYFGRVKPPPAEKTKPARPSLTGSSSRRPGAFVGELDPKVAETFRDGFDAKLLEITAGEWLTATEISEQLEGLPTNIVEDALHRLLVEGRVARSASSAGSAGAVLKWCSKAPKEEPADKPLPLLKLWDPVRVISGPHKGRSGRVTWVSLDGKAVTTSLDKIGKEKKELVSVNGRAAVEKIEAPGEVVFDVAAGQRLRDAAKSGEKPAEPIGRAETWSEGVKTTTGKMAACAEAIRAYLARADVTDVTDEQLAAALPDFDKGLVGMMILVGTRETNETRKIVRDSATTAMRLATKAPAATKVAAPAARKRRAARAEAR